MRPVLKTPRRAVSRLPWSSSAQRLPRPSAAETDTAPGRSASAPPDATRSENEAPAAASAAQSTVAHSRSALSRTNATGSISAPDGATSETAASAAKPAPATHSVTRPVRGTAAGETDATANEPSRNTMSNAPSSPLSRTT